MKNGSLWEELALEMFTEDHLLWDRPSGSGEEHEEDEGAAETMCDK